MNINQNGEAANSWVRRRVGASALSAVPPSFPRKTYTTKVLPHVLILVNTKGASLQCECGNSQFLWRCTSILQGIRQRELLLAFLMFSLSAGKQGVEE